VHADLCKSSEKLFCIVGRRVDEQVQVVGRAVGAMPRHGEATDNEEADTCRDKGFDERLVAAEM
jgi:hypothetical protein